MAASEAEAPERRAVPPVVGVDPASGLHPAEHRALRELYASARQLCSHWGALARRLPGSTAGDALERGADAAAELLSELSDVAAHYGLYGKPAAQGVGARLAGLRRVGDRFLERNQALRLGLLDISHTTTLLPYLGSLAAARDDERLGEFCGRWERKLKRHERALRAAVLDLGTDPEAAIDPVDASPVGQAAAGAANVVGTVGEWFDGRAGRR
jgi:hypothetical protein